jgi:hypothetical protein
LTVSTIFYSVSLSHSGGLGWTTHKVSFEEGPINAHFMLSAYDVQNDESYVSFEPRFAYAYIETPETPTSNLGGVSVPMVNQFTDNSVWLTTDWVTFLLEGQNVTAGAVGVIFDRRADGVEEQRRVVRAIDLALHDDDGVVHGTHSEVQLEGARDVDVDEVRELALARGQQRTGQQLRATPIDRNEIPAGVSYKIEPKTGRIQPL